MPSTFSVQYARQSLRPETQQPFRTDLGSTKQEQLHSVTAHRSLRSTHRLHQAAANATFASQAAAGTYGGTPRMIEEYKWRLKSLVVDALHYQHGLRHKQQLREVTTTIGNHTLRTEHDLPQDPRCVVKNTSSVLVTTASTTTSINGLVGITSQLVRLIFGDIEGFFSAISSPTVHQRFGCGEDVPAFEGPAAKTSVVCMPIVKIESIKVSYSSTRVGVVVCLQTKNISFTINNHDLEI